MASLREPLALADVDGSVTGVSPLTRFFADAALAPLTQNFSFLSRSPQMLESVLRSLLGGE